MGSAAGVCGCDCVGVDEMTKVAGVLMWTAVVFAAAGIACQVCAFIARVMR